MSSRRALGDKFVLATHNKGKIREFKNLLAPLGINVVPAEELDLPEPDETGVTFVENARLKAQAAASRAGLPALADDSGLEVRGLEGRPGVETARWAGPQRDFAHAMRRVRKELAERFGTFERADRQAAFVCVLCLAWPDGRTEEFEGRVEGLIAPEPRGEHGFGYDPIFLPESSERTFGEMLQDEKAALSHRARATQALLQALSEREAG